MLNRVEIRRLTWPLHNIPLVLPSKAPGLLLQYVLGHRPYVHWSAVQSTLLHLAESGQRVYPSLSTSEFIRLLLSSVTSSINTSNPVPLEAMNAHTITLLQYSTMFHRWCCMLWNMSCSKPSPYFFLPVILVQVDLNFSYPKNAFPEVVWLFLWCFWSNMSLW